MHPGRLNEERREMARLEATTFSVKTLEVIGRVLDIHTAKVVEFACEMQERLDAAEGLLAEIAAGKRHESQMGRFTTVKLRSDVVKRMDALLTSAKARTP